MESKKKALGKGLEELFSNASFSFDNFENEIVKEEKNNSIEINLSDIHANPYQPRKSFSNDSLNELASSIKEYGVVEAYQMDGGGSVTAVISKDGAFTTVNSPCDGAPRSIFSALLMVERRKPEVDLTIVNYDDKETTFKFELAMHGCSCKKLEFVIGSTTYDITEENGELYAVAGKLRLDKEYEYKILVTTDRDELVTVMGTFKLPPLKPSIKTCTVIKTEESKAEEQKKDEHKEEDSKPENHKAEEQQNKE